MKEKREKERRGNQDRKVTIFGPSFFSLFSSFSFFFSIILKEIIIEREREHEREKEEENEGKGRKRSSDEN